MCILIPFNKPFLKPFNKLMRYLIEYLISIWNLNDCVLMYLFVEVFLPLIW